MLEPLANLRASSPSMVDPAGRVYGIVSDRLRKGPIVGASIALSNGTTVVAETMTDDRGQFDLPCAAAELRVRAPGFLERVESPICDARNVIALTPGVQIRGVVLGPRDSAQVGASVVCTSGSVLRAFDETVTDARGAFELRRCSSGDVRLRAEHAGSGVAPALLEIGPLAPTEERNGIVVRLADGRSIRGVVIDHEGNAESAQIVALESGAWTNVTTARTRADGSFEVAVSRSSHEIAAFADDGRTAHRKVAAGHLDIELEFRLEGGLPLKGRLVGDTHDVVVEATREPGESNELGRAIRDLYWARMAHGSYTREAIISGDSFVFPHLDPGIYEIHATSPVARGKATVDTRTDKGLTVTLESAATFVFSAEDQMGEPVGGTLNLNCSEFGTVRRVMGKIKISGLPTGECELRFVPTEGLTQAPIKIRLPIGETTHRWTSSRTPEFRVEGRIVDGHGTPLGGAEISFASEVEGFFERTASSALTDSNGAFEISVPSTDQMLFVFRQGYVSTTVRARELGAAVTLVPGKSLPIVTIR